MFLTASMCLAMNSSAGHPSLMFPCERLISLPFREVFQSPWFIASASGLGLVSNEYLSFPKYRLNGNDTYRVTLGFYSYDPISQLGHWSLSGQYLAIFIEVFQRACLIGKVLVDAAWQIAYLLRALATISMICGAASSAIPSCDNLTQTLILSLMNFPMTGISIMSSCWFSDNMPWVLPGKPVTIWELGSSTTLNFLDALAD